MKLSELVVLAQNGDEEAFTMLVRRLIPLIKKYGLRYYGQDEVSSDVSLRLVIAIKKYRPKTTWGRDELQSYYTSKHKEKNKKDL
jgi:hypothetical protein